MLEKIKTITTKKYTGTAKVKDAKGWPNNFFIRNAIAEFDTVISGDTMVFDKFKGILKAQITLKKVTAFKFLDITSFVIKELGYKKSFEGSFILDGDQNITGNFNKDGISGSYSGTIPITWKNITGLISVAKKTQMVISDVKMNQI